jgi:hypothetical protein
VKIVAWNDDVEVLVISTDILPGDDPIEIPDTLYSKYNYHFNSFVKIQNEIREFKKKQEKERDLFQEESGIKVLRYRD